MNHKSSIAFAITRIRANREGGVNGFVGNDADDLVVPPALRTPSNFTMLFTGDLRPIEPANLFMLERCCGPGRSRRWQNTQMAYADDLATWWTFLEANDLRWDAIDRQDILGFAQALAMGISSVTGRQFSPQTRARRIGTVEGFYRWAFDAGFVAEPVVGNARNSLRAMVRQGTLAPAGSFSVNARSETRPKQPAGDERVNPISHADLPRILEALGPGEGLRAQGDARRVRDRLIAETSLVTGMRVEEIVALTIYQIQALEPYLDHTDPYASLTMPITVTKGGRPRKVVIPAGHVAKLVDYIDGERADVLRSAVARGKFADGARQPVALFLNHEGSNLRDAGEQVSTRTASCAFTSAVLSLELIRSEVGYEIDPDTGTPCVDGAGQEIRVVFRFPKHTFHDLRHTFAVRYYHIAARHGEPLKKLQARLGHARLETTARIYLRHVGHDDEPKLADELAAFLRRSPHDIG